VSLRARDDPEVKQLLKDLARETLERYREINLLYRASETIGACLNTAVVPRLVLEEAERVISAPVAAVILGADGVPAESRGASEEISELLTGATELVDRVLSNGRPDIEMLDGRQPSETGLQSALGVPIRAGEVVLGVVLLGRKSNDPPFTASDEKLLLGLASQAGVALERARMHEQETRRQRLDEELAVARRIQLSLLPAHLPRVDGWSFAVAYSAARQVGGDFYDFMEHALAEQRLGFVIADVAGKGVPAALMMAYCRALLRAESMAGRPPAQLLEQTNRLILSDRQTRPFVTAFYVEFDLDSGRLSYANAGHDAPLLITANGQCRQLDAPGVILGAFDDIVVEQHEVLLGHGDVVVFYTDGVTEARDPAGRFFGDERLLAAATSAGGSAQAVLDSVAGAVREFTAGAEQADDVTIVVVQYNAEGAPWNE
jgi:serine phosphatase RsbU (regulator of sigma subunit)